MSGKPESRQCFGGHPTDENFNSEPEKRERIKILKREMTNNENTHQMTNNVQYKSLHQRILEYEAARKRIFNEEVSFDVKETSNYRKIRKLRAKCAIKRQTINKIESTILAISDDNRPYAKVLVDGEQMLGLLDSGASISCLGKGAIDFLTRHNHQMTKLTLNIKTADGNSQNINGRITTKVTWNGKTKELELYVVPSLQQQLYLGVDFWRIFK